jgi:hypothetical protein
LQRAGVRNRSGADVQSFDSSTAEFEAALRSEEPKNPAQFFISLKPMMFLILKRACDHCS